MTHTPRVTIILPRVLAQVTGGERGFAAQGATLREALQDLGNNTPGLMVHFFDDANRVRKNIICIHGNDYVRAGTLADHRVEDGDEIQIINALAGG